MRAETAHAAMRALPVRTFDAIFGPAPLLILAPHPDDESLGCGGTIAEACARGHRVHVAILTDGTKSHPGSKAWPAPRLAAKRRAEALAATRALGLAPEYVHFLDEPDTRAPQEGEAFEAALRRLCAILTAARIGTLCSSWRGDPHGDHTAAAILADYACRNLDLRHLAYPVWGWTLEANARAPDIAGGARLDIARHLPRKRRAIAAHATQHAGLIDDDPQGFQLSPSFLALFDGRFETFVEAP